MYQINNHYCYIPLSMVPYFINVCLFRHSLIQLSRHRFTYIEGILPQGPDPPCIPLRWRHNGRDSGSNHQPHDCLLNRLFRRRSKKTSKLRVTGLCTGNSPGTGEFPAQMASYAENVSIWWRHHAHGRFWQDTLDMWPSQTTRITLVAHILATNPFISL